MGNVAYIQGALLYTTSSGERRIRVHTLAIPTTNLASDVFNGVDIDALCNLMAKSEVEMIGKIGVGEARKRLQQKCVDILRFHRNAMTASSGYGARGQTNQPLPPSLQLLPLYTMALQKNAAFRGGMDIPSDMRSYLLQQVRRIDDEGNDVW